jgi:hypothetical protein
MAETFRALAKKYDYQRKIFITLLEEGETLAHQGKYGLELEQASGLFREDDADYSFPGTTAQSQLWAPEQSASSLLCIHPKLIVRFLNSLVLWSWFISLLLLNN